MKRKNTLKAAAIGMSILTLTGISGIVNAGTIAIAEPEAADVKHDAKAIEVIEKSIKATGGRELLESAKFVHTKGTLSMPAAGIEGTIETWLHAPDKLYVLVNIPMFGEQKQGINGDVAWSSDPMGGPRLLPEDEAKALRDESDPASRLDFEKDNKVLEYVGEVEFDGQKAHKIRLVDHDDNQSHEYYSVEKGYMLGMEAKVPTQMGQVQMTSYMREYKEMGGVLQPTKMMQKAGPQEFHITISEVSYDDIDASKFELPDAIKALVKAQEHDD
ncbi:MAG: LolA-like protein [Phycisphaerales bacterium]